MTVQEASTNIKAWLSFTGTLPDSDSESVFEDLLAAYCKIKQAAFTLPVSNEMDLNKFNPLSKVSSGNPWAVQFENQSRMNEIKLDVDRTHQEVDLFQREDVQKSLINILFVFGKVYAIPYRQGMNEIAAIIFTVVSGACVTSSMETKESVAYAILSGLMMKKRLADFFFPEAVTHKSEMESGGGSSPLLSRCEKIFELLGQKDARLHKHLVMQDVAPNLFLLRWVRLLFAREYSIPITIKIWESLFEDTGPGDPFEFPCMVDYLAVAMILNVRQSLMCSDNSGCFSILLKYPTVEDVGQLLDLADRLKQGRSPVVMVPQQPTKRELVVSELSSVIADLKKSEVAKSIQREITKLEDIVGYLKTPSAR
jgi:TBC1 domain family protein 5